MEAFFIYSAIILSLPFFASTAPKTTVILLPSEHASAVNVATQSGSVTIDQPYTLTKLVSAEAKPLPIESTDENHINEKYGSILEALPKTPISILFYYEEGSSELVPSSKEQVYELVKIIAARAPAAVDIIGHSDRAGSDEKNYILALERAESLKKFLEQHDVKMERVKVVSYGENDPLIPTQDGVPEPKNRRVEVTIR